MATTNTSGNNSLLNPSCAILKFWQGIVEIVLRAIVTILSFGLMVSTAVVISESPTCFTCRNITTVYWLLIAALAIMLGEAFNILLRFVNLKFTFCKTPFPFALEAGSTAFLAISVLIGASVLAAFPADLVTVNGYHIYWTVATSPTLAFSFLLVLALMLLAGWLALFQYFKWDDKRNQ